MQPGCTNFGAGPGKLSLRRVRAKSGSKLSHAPTNCAPGVHNPSFLAFGPRCNCPYLESAAGFIDPDYIRFVFAYKELVFTACRPFPPHAWRQVLLPDEFSQLVHATIHQIEAAQFLPHSGIRFPQNPCSSCPYVGLCLNRPQLVEARLIVLTQAEWAQSIQGSNVTHKRLPREQASFRRQSQC